MSEDQKQPSVLWLCVALVLVMPILYFLSLGPISLLLNRAEPDMPEGLEVACGCYLFPAEFVYELSPEPVRNVLTGYIELFDE